MTAHREIAMRASKAFGLVALLCLLGFTEVARAQDGSWSAVASGNWSDATKWTGGVIANGANNTATFATPSLTVPLTVTLDTSRIIGNLTFDNPTNNFGWTLRGNAGTTLTLSNATTPTIAVNNANISATLTATLAGTQGFVKTGAGTLSITGNNTGLSGGINVSAGVLAVTGSTIINPLGSNVVTLSGGTLRLGGSGGGFNQRMVVPVGTTFGTSGITATMDGGTTLAGNTWYELGQNVAAPTTGVPMGQMVASASDPSIVYTMQPATARHVLMLDNGGGNTTGRFTLASPSTLSNVSFLTSSGNGAGTVTATLHYSDGTPDATGLTFTSPDWFNNPANIAIIAAGRISAAGYNNVNTANPRLYDATIANPNPGNPISSIDLSWTGGANTHTAIFGVANTTVLNGDPAQNFTNNVVVTADSAIDVRAALGASLGNLSIGTNVLSVTGLAGTSLTLGGISLTGNATINPAAGITATVGALSDGGTVRTFTANGAGTLNFAAASPGFSAGGQVAITAGIANLNNATAFGTSPNVALSANSTLNLGTGVSPTLASLAGAGGSVNLNGNTLTFGNGTGSFAGQINNGSAPGAIVKTGGGTQTLSGNNTFTGGVTVSGGKLAATSPAVLGANAISLTGGTLSLAGLPAGTLTGFAGGAGWTPNGSATFPSQNALQLTPNAGGQAGSAWNNIPFSTGAFTLSFTYTTVSASNPPADGITVGFQNMGLNALGGGGGSLGYETITPSAVLAINIYPPNTTGGVGSGVKVLTNGAPPGGGFTPMAPVNPGLVGTPTDVVVTYDGTNVSASFTQGANVFNTGPVPLDIPGTVGPTGFFGFTGATGGLTAQQQITNLVTSFPVAAQTTFANDISVSGATPSTIAIAATAATPSLTVGALTMASGSTLNVGVDTGTPTGQAFFLTFGATTLNGPATLSVANNGAAFGTVTLGAIGGSGPLTKTGPGILVLPQASTHTAGVNVNGGRLIVTNTTGSATGTGLVTVNSGGTLGGTGTIAGNIQVNAGGTIAPGSPLFPATAPGILTANSNVSFAGGTFAAKLNGNTAGSGYDQLHALGTVSLGTNVTALSTSLGYAPSSGDSLTIIQGGTVDAGRFANLPDNTAFLVGAFAGTPYTAVIHYSTNSVFLNTFTPVPEPVHLLLVGGIVGMTWGWRGRRQPK